MDVAEFLQQLDQLFELEPGTLTLASIVEETPGWGSLTFLGLIALTDDMYRVTLKPRQIHQCSTVGDLFSLVDKLHFSAATT
jgi:acyl carrier protein